MEVRGPDTAPWSYRARGAHAPLVFPRQRSPRPGGAGSRLDHRGARRAPITALYFAAAAFQSFALGVTPTTAYFPFFTCVRMMFE